MTATLKGLKIKTLHKYILSPDTETDNKMLSEKVLLNNKPLDLINDKELPNLNPEIVTNPDDLELKLSSGNIGFWVIPNAKVKACAYPEEETAEIMKTKLSKRDKNIIWQDNREKKINDTDNHQHSVQESERVKRDVSQKLVEIGLRKDNVLKKRSRLDNVKDVNERKTKRRDDSRKDELIPFNPRTADSGEDNFYGFLRHEPIKGFPESDIFITTGDSLEQNNKDYDYVQDESNENDSKNMQRRKELQDHTEDDTWLEMENDYIPNEFFENVKINARIQESPKNYSDLWEAEVFPQESSRIRQEQLSIEKAEKRAVEKLFNYYDSKEQEHDRDTKYEDRALRRSSMPLSQFVKTPIYIDHQASNIKPEERKLKLQSGASSFFYQPSQATINYNYNNNHAKNTKHEDKLNKEIFDINISNDGSNINTETIKFSRPADVDAEYSIHEIQYPILHDRRIKRSNSKAKMQKILANEKIKKNEKNSKNCRINQVSHLSKKLRRAKRDSEIFADSSSEIRSAQSKINVEDSITKEEYEKIMAGEILSSTVTNSITNSIESDYEEHDTLAETITTESSTLKYRPSYESSTSIMDNSEIDDISKRYNLNNSNVKRFVNSEFSPINVENSNNSDIVNDNDITKEMFFRAESSDVETTTYDPSQIVSKIYSINKNDLQEFVVASATENAQKTTCEETQSFISKEEKADNSGYPTVTEKQKVKEWRDNNDKIRLRKSMSSLETTKGIVEEQMTTESILPKLTTDRTIDSSTKSNDDVQANVEDDENIDSKALTQSKKNIDAKKLKTTCRKTSKGHARYAKKLTNEQTDKLNKRFMKRLMRQYYHNELTKIVDAEKRNLRRREAWESDGFRHLIDQGEFIGILIDDNVLYKDTNNENYEIPIEFIKKIHYPKYNKIYQFPRHLKVIEDDGESIKYHQHSEHLPNTIKDEQEASRFSDHEHDQDCRYSTEMIENERESEETSKSDDSKIFVIDPSTYRDDHPTLQLHEKHSKFPYKYYPKIKLENQNPIPRRTLEKIYQVLSKSTSSEDRVSKLQEYMKKTINKNYDQGNEKFTQNLLDRQNINQTVNNKTATDLNNTYKNIIEVKHDNSDMSTTDKSMELTKNARIKKYIENEKSINYHDEKEDIMNNVKKTENTTNTEKNMIPKNIGTDKEEMLNMKRFNDITEAEYTTKYLNNKRENKANKYKIEKDTREVIKPYNSNEEIQNNIEISNNNKTAKSVEKVIDNNVKLSKFRRGNTRKQRDINTQGRDKYLKHLLHFLLTRTDIQDKSNSDIYDYSTEDSEEIFSDQQSSTYLLTKKDESPLSNILLRKLKNYLASSKKDLEINQQVEKKYKPPKYIVFIPTKNEDSYKILEVKDFNDASTESFEIPHSENQYLPRKISDSIIRYSNDESSEELEYEDLSDLLNENAENTSNKKAYSSESMQDVSVDVENVGIKRDSEMKDEQYRNKKIQCLETKNQISSDKCGMFLLFPWGKNEKIRQRREIGNRNREGINKIGSEMQSKSNKFLTENIKDESIEDSLSKNNIDKQEKEKIITEKETGINYLQTQIEKRNRDNLLEDFVKARQKNYLYKKKTFFMENKEKDKNLENNISKSDEKLSSFIEKITPKLQNGIIDDLENTQNFTESVEPFMDNFEEKFNKTVLASNEEKNFKSKTDEPIGNPFQIAIINIKRFLAFLSGISQLFI